MTDGKVGKSGNTRSIKNEENLSIKKISSMLTGLTSNSKLSIMWIFVLQFSLNQTFNY